MELVIDEVTFTGLPTVVMFGLMFMPGKTAAPAAMICWEKPVIKHRITSLNFVGKPFISLTVALYGLGFIIVKPRLLKINE
ncbi:MAG: hypothetical protein ABL933_00710 [Methyloglobulus sp.]